MVPFNDNRLDRAGVIVGVDPGLSGALAFMDLRQPATVAVVDIPVHVLERGKRARREIDVAGFVSLLTSRVIEHAFVERAGAMPKQGVVSVFKYGTAFGALCAVTAICEIPTHLVSPRKWKNHFGLDADKERSRALVIRLWPGTGLFERKKDHGRSEAALLARYGAEVIEVRR